MITLKFGGTSMANARRILASADIIINRGKEDRLSVIVSAVAGVSNTLQSAIDASTTGIVGTNYVTDLRNIHNEICLELQSKLPGFDAEKTMAKIEPNFVELEKLLAGCVSFGECPDTVYCRIMGMGELLSAPIMELVAIEAMEKILFLPILLKPWAIQYPKELNFINRATLLYISCNNSITDSYSTFSHGTNNVHIMSYNNNCRSSFIGTFQKLHNLP